MVLILCLLGCSRSEASVTYLDRTISIEVEEANWSSDSPETLYYRFPIRQWIRDAVASEQEIPAGDFDGTAVIKVGKETTVF